MVERTTQEWFLEVEGRKTGPFPTEQILGLLADHEIPETTRVLSAAPGSSWITVRELADSENRKSKSFVPPPRPTEAQASPETENASASPAAPAASKPEHSLLDALLAAKERKAQSARALPPEHSEAAHPNPFQLQNIPRKVWMMVGTAALLCIAAWGLAHFIKQTSPNLATNQETAEPSHHVPPPPAPAPTAEPPSGRPSQPGRSDAATPGPATRHQHHRSDFHSTQPGPKLALRSRVGAGPGTRTGKRTRCRAGTRQ